MPKLTMKWALIIAWAMIFASVGIRFGWPTLLAIYVFLGVVALVIVTIRYVESPEIFHE